MYEGLGTRLTTLLGTELTHTLVSLSCYLGFWMLVGDNVHSLIWFVDLVRVYHIAS